ncbi:MAG: 5-demethoxyubiquinol-8 5-hydroxylase UbiM [Gammaproteobacteria bacterium]|jgi:ubiquinone biosynthesis UbiH/UbiF/VisC/COQ6 family hydroxylase|nr:5-demethoxyubiquinol-8 5-hydroxylase UbiM [Gammaproteobacteria bacterium]MBT4608198.1 5-demethoxyubiquinol-8 5-hydroxylase UbiM [Thiotrichales bacterium]MBT3472202.1 5-demethoxyubiquinol-8 5-hydroxylase UbiM [Gammaproteobacteria bacterium]MBT3965999.1 5-demethoxyubiquinol-8 5-hydroxylase UbiM [Gammaproteobacteria bacterium]MBT4079923.1 5-demethoxyubiquinol-8 5-hydroxylase UbiM [Gammaproteobacteria bacterium]
MSKFDVVVIGAGTAGLGFGCSLADSGLSVLILERQALTEIENPAFDGRDFAITHLSKKLLQQLNIWERIPQQEIAPLREAKVLDGESDYTLAFNTEGRSVNELGYLISNHVIRKATYEQLLEADNVELRTDVEVSGLKADQQGAVVTLADGSEIEAQMAVSADTRFSATRRMMGLSAEMFDFGRTAIVCRAEHELSNEATALECFRYGRTLALLPLNGDESSVVITVPSSQADRYMQMDDAEFNATIEEGLGGRYGKMSLSTERFSYPLVAVHANKMVGNRYALLGDAAVGMHPVTAHGFNLGLRGQHTLAERMKQALARGESFYSDEVLSHYNQKQQLASRPIYHGTNSIVRLFTTDSAPAKLLRKAALRFGNHFPPVQWGIIHKLTEVGGMSGLSLPTVPSMKGFSGKIPHYSSR